jgi:hypothetical protein
VGPFVYDEAFALVRLAFDPHITRMDNPKTQFEPIQLKGDSRWFVRITLPHGVQSQISDFKTEAEARTWIGENSDVWLAHGVQERIHLGRSLWALVLS